MCPKILASDFLFLRVGDGNYCESERNCDLDSDEAQSASRAMD